MLVSGIDPVSDFLGENFTKKGTLRKGKQVECNLVLPGGKKVEGSVTKIKIANSSVSIVVGGKEHYISNRDTKSERTKNTARFHRPVTLNPEGGFEGSFKIVKKK